MAAKIKIDSARLVALVSEEHMKMHETPCAEILEEAIAKAIAEAFGFTIGDGGSLDSPQFDFEILEISSIEKDIRHRPEHILIKSEMWIEVK
jgi:hypothetical protein